MKESFEITALRMAQMLLDKPRKGKLKDLQAMARELLKDEPVQQLPLPLPAPAPLPVVEAQRPKRPTIVHIRWMIRRDMPEVLDIEAKSFEYAWAEEDFIRVLRQRNCIGWSCELDERVVGFMIYALHKTRLHVLSMAVHPEFRSAGIGRQLVEKLKSKLSVQRRNKVVLEVRESNLAAQSFFKSLGFRAISILREFYEDCNEDAYLMQFTHTAPAPAPQESQKPNV